MNNVIDLTGQRFGRLTVLRRGEDYIDPVNYAKPWERPRRRLQWVCRCDCGKEVLTQGASLKAGRTTSCGCARKGRRKKTDD